MAENHTNAIGTSERVPMSAIFHVIGEQAEDVVRTALQQRPSVSESARAALNAAIDNSGITIGGFRKPSRAQPPDLLNAHVLGALLDDNDKLASAVLRVWAEALPELARMVTDHLEEQGVPVLDSKRDCFHTIWPQNMCLLEGNILSSKHSELEHHDVALMLCYLSGRFPEETTLNSSLFNEWLKHLNGLPLDAPEWDEAHSFIADLIELSSAKVADRQIVLREAFNDTVSSVAEAFADELNYLGLDIRQWTAGLLSDSAAVAEACALVDSLNAALEAYSKVRPQAPTRGEELHRAQERNECEAEILTIADRWNELDDTSQEPDKSDAQASADLDAPANVTIREHEELRAARERLVAENTRLAQANDALKQSRGNLQTEKEELAEEKVRLSEENSALQHAYDNLRMEKEEESKENSRLKRQLRESKRREEAWRGAPALPHQTGDVAEDSHPRVDSVRDAIVEAENNFPDQLVVALNSRSKEDTPFQRPSEVYSVLAWLATDYRHMRSNPAGSDPDFDKMLKKVCTGWSYVPHQSAVTIGMFKDWYYTTVDGVKYELAEHLGKGNSGNPQHTIRIAFAWDADLQKVIVGYVGHHQRNQGS